MAQSLMKIFTLIMILVPFMEGHYIIHRALKRLGAPRSRERLIFSRESIGRKDNLPAYRGGHPFVTRTFLTRRNPEESVRYTYSPLLELTTQEPVRSPVTEKASRPEPVEIIVDERLPFYCDREEVGAASCDVKLSYRSLNGRCNNVQNPLWGKHTSSLRRILQPQYDDQVSRPRFRSKRRRHLLPNVRTVSNRLHNKGNSVATDTRY